MSEEAFELLAMDPVGGQAIYRHGRRWFLIAFDHDWRPIELVNQADALRCTLQAPYESRNEPFPDERSLIESIETRWDRSFFVEDTPLSEVIHLFPVALRRAWETAQQREAAREESNKQQRRRRQIDDTLDRGRKKSFKPESRLLGFRPTTEPVEHGIWVATAELMNSIVVQLQWPRKRRDVEDRVTEASYRLAIVLQKDLPLLEELQNNTDRFQEYAVSFLMQQFRRASYESRRLPKTVSLGKVSDDVRNLTKPPPSSFVLLDLREVLTQAIAGFPSHESQVLRAYFSSWPIEWPRLSVDTVEELSVQMHIKNSTVVSVLRKGLKRLRSYLQEAGIGPEDF